MPKKITLAFKLGALSLLSMLLISCASTFLQDFKTVASTPDTYTLRVFYSPLNKSDADKKLNSDATEFAKSKGYSSFKVLGRYESSANPYESSQTLKSFMAFMRPLNAATRNQAYNDGNEPCIEYRVQFFK